MKGVCGVFLFFLLAVSSLSSTSAALTAASSRSLLAGGGAEGAREGLQAMAEAEGAHRPTRLLPVWSRARAVDILGQPLLHGQPNFKHVVLRDGEDVPDLDLQVNRDAFDDYVTNLLQGRVHAMQHAEWQWLDNLLRDTKRVVGSGIQKLADAGRTVIDGLGEGIRSAAEGISRGVKEAADNIARGFAAIANLPQLLEAFGRLKTFVQNVGGILQSFGDIKFWDFLRYLVVGLVSGFTMGSAEDFVTNLLIPPSPKPKGPNDALIMDLKTTFRQAGEEVAKTFSGLFGGADKRGGQGRLDFMKNQLKNVVSAVAKVWGALVRIVMTEQYLEKIRGIMITILLTAIFTLVLIAIPGLGWFVKLASMIVTAILGVVRFVLVIVPRFISLLKACWDHFKCTPEQTGQLVKNAFEVVGMAAAIFLAGRPDANIGFEGFSGAFKQNPIAKAMNLRVNPDVFGTINSFKSALTGVGTGKASSVLNTLKATGALNAIKGGVIVPTIGKRTVEIFTQR